MPKRIQFSRRKKLPPNAVYVGRPSRFGNPFRVEHYLSAFDGQENRRERSQEAVVELYREWLDESPQGKELKLVIRAELRGKDLACWCAPGTPCHADVLLKVANGK